MIASCTMVDLPLPAPVLMSIAIAAALIALELLGWFALSPRLARLLPFAGEVPRGLPTPGGARLSEPARGTGPHVAWRWHPGSRARIFRRRLEPGRKPYCIGCLSLDARGAWRLRWAPFPLFGWAAATASWFAAILGLGWTALPGGLLISGAASLLFLLAIAANLHLSRRAFERLVWPEAQQQLRVWLAGEPEQP